MDQDISVTSDWRSEMSVESSCQSIMESLLRVNFTKRKVDCLIHASCCHYPHELVEEWISWSLSFIHALSKFLWRFCWNLKSEFRELLWQILDFFFLWLWMPSQNGKRREVHRDLLSNCNVSKKHEFFNHIMGIHMLIFGDICWILAVVVEFEFDFGRGKGQCTIWHPLISQCCCNFEQASQSFRKWSMIVRVVNHILGLVVAQRFSGSDDRFSVIYLDSFECLCINLEDDWERTSVNMADQRAKTFSQQARQHIGSPVHHVHSSTPSCSLFINLRSCSNKMCDISNMHANLVVPILKRNAV